MYRYFISFVSKTGFGCTELGRRTPIQGLDDIRQVLDDIRRELHVEATSVISFQLFDN